MPRRRVTIDEVAQEAGVSRQTVSNVLRGTGRVGDQTALRIQEVVARLGYAPHPGASSMRSKRTGQLAYALTEHALEPGNVIMMEFLRSLISAAGQLGYHVLATATGVDGLRELARSGRVDGFVFSDMYGYDERLHIVDETHTPFASFGRVPDGLGLRQAWVDVDNVAGLLRSTEHLIDLGHRDILYLGHPIDGYWDTERLDGYLTAMREHGLTPRTLTPDADDDAVAAAVTSVLAEPDRPTGIVCSADVLAVDVYRAAAALGLVVGHDLSVSSFESSVIGRSLVPALTSMTFPVETIGRLVAERFVAEVRDPGAPVEGLLVAPELVVGASTAAPAAG